MLARSHRGPIALAILLVLIGAACAGNAVTRSSEQGAGDTSGGSGGEHRMVGFAHENAPGSGTDTVVTNDQAGGNDSGTSTSDPLGTGPSIIKNGSISVRVGDGEVRDGMQDVVSLASRFGGYVTSSSISSGDNASADVVIRVPAANFEKAVAAVGDIGKIDEQNVTGEDVTDQVVDLEARLRNAQAQEAVLLRLMDQSQSVADTIRVQQTLSGVQLDIERLRGQLRNLDDLTSYGTLAVSLFEGAPVVADSNVLERAWDVAKNTASAIVSGVALGLAFLLPVLLFLAAAAVVVVPVAKRVRRRLA